MYKYAYIGLKQDYIRIYTGYRTESWLTIFSKPIYLLPTDAKESEIKDCLMDCLKHSREITKEEEDKEYYLGNELLKLLKEKSWKSSYNSNTCKISYRDDIGFNLSFTKYDHRTRSSPIVKEVNLDITSFDEIDIDFIMKTLKILN